ncbi:hypothetical protein PL9631_900005 [Planktothrix paucivesiculata PCC 9631]|uniref:Uncharacterized protein n=1 Tax=Planktothrix paucivesiculata PCC 9631 TaxID=671071 RepID=A0A7Z9BY33_9CYAN|nr:hypothetical protein PL9631_900005 [Planktothrix paucivesiculata PCC 9631]
MAEGRPSANTVFEVVNINATFKDLVTLLSDCNRISRWKVDYVNSVLVLIFSLLNCRKLSIPTKG